MDILVNILRISRVVEICTGREMLKGRGWISVNHCIFRIL